MSATVFSDVSDMHLFVTARFTGLKHGTVKQYKEYRKEKGSTPHKCKIERVVVLSLAEYEEFCNDLSVERSYLAGQGGTDSSVEFDKPSHQWTEAERRAWMLVSWRCVVAVTCENQPTIFVDPSCYNYARYIGLAE